MHNPSYQELLMVLFLPPFPACKMPSGKEGFHMFAKLLTSWGDGLSLSAADAGGSPVALHHDTSPPAWLG